jgi:hypothetical protein
LFQVEVAGAKAVVAAIEDHVVVPVTEGLEVGAMIGDLVEG